MPLGNAKNFYRGGGNDGSARGKSLLSLLQKAHLRKILKSLQILNITI